MTLHKVGDRVGVGASSWACLECRQCRRDNEQYCPRQLDTYGALWPGAAGEGGGYVTKGGYASHARVHEHYCFPVPASLPAAAAAPMMCAGLTVYSPLRRGGCGPGARVGVVGVGGLGHLAVMLARAMGAEVWAFAPDRSREGDARALGAAGTIVVGGEDRGEGGGSWDEPHRRGFDMILNSASSSVDPSPYLPLLDVHGRWISVSMVSAPELFSSFCLLFSCVMSATPRHVFHCAHPPVRRLGGFLQVEASGNRGICSRPPFSSIFFLFCSEMI